MRIWIAALLLIAGSPSWAVEATITDGDTLLLGATPYRLDGIDAPETDQVCLDETGALWACGIEARDQLAKFVGKRNVRCDGKKYDTVYRNRRIGICNIEGEPMSLNQWLVREGWALNFEPHAKGRFKLDENNARENGRGLWKGCFTRPQSARRSNKSTATLLGAACDNTKVQRYATCYSLIIPPCPQAAQSRENLLCVRRSPAIAASITWKAVAVMDVRRCRSVGSARKTKRRLRAFAKRSLADAAPPLHTSRTHRVTAAY